MEESTTRREGNGEIERLIRKREAARIRQQRCRARKKAAQAVEVKDNDFQKSSNHQSYESSPPYCCDTIPPYYHPYPPTEVLPAQYHQTDFFYYGDPNSFSSTQNGYQFPYPPSAKWHLLRPVHINHSEHTYINDDYSIEEQENAAPLSRQDKTSILVKSQTPQKDNLEEPVEHMEIAAIDAMLSLGSSSSDNDDGRSLGYSFNRPVEYMFTPIREESEHGK